jgi:recombination protein RecA
MRTKLSLAALLNQLLRRWVGFAQTSNTSILFLNQLRIDPTKMFGNPEYSPGGKALKFYCHARIKIRRTNKGGYLKKANKIIGLKGVMTVLKSKVGAHEGDTAGYKLYHSGKSVYTSADKVQKD